MSYQPSQSDQTLSRDEMETILRNASLWDREEYCRKNPSMRTVSLGIPYNLTFVWICCEDLNEYTIHMISDQGERFSLRFNNENMQKYKGESDVHPENIPLLGSDKNETFDKLIKIYFGQTSKQLEGFHLEGLPPSWNTDTVLSVKKLYISCNSEDESIEHDGFNKFLNQIGTVLKTEVSMNSMMMNSANGLIIYHNFFQTHSFECHMTTFHIIMLLRIAASDCKIYFKLFISNVAVYAECLANYAEKMVILRPIGFTIAFDIPEERRKAHEIIEWILENKEGWVFKTYDKSFAVTFVWREKEVVLSYEAPNSVYRLNVHSAYRLQPFIIDRDHLIPLNRELMSLPYETRKEEESQFPWEACLLYKIREMEIDFEKLEVKIEEKMQRFPERSGLYKFLSELFCHSETSVDSLLVEGTDNNSESMVRQISAKEITFTYMGVHSVQFFEWFNYYEPSIYLEKITTTTFESIRHGWFLVKEAQQVVITNNRGSRMPEFP
ncbi:unnamed protein product [Caenorhabditis brenneri]